jgi:hypothetical protein
MFLPQPENNGKGYITKTGNRLPQPVIFFAEQKSRQAAPAVAVSVIAKGIIGCYEESTNT